MIRLLPSSVDTPPTPEVSSQSTSLVLANRQAAAIRAQSSTTPELQDSHIWSVSVADDGSFNFYSVPRNASGNGSTNQNQSSTSSGVANSGWNAFRLQSAAAKYAFYASLSTSSYGQMLNVYA